MGDKIAHRGPDHQGVYLTKDRKFGVVHQRLAIIDLDERANQPMTSDCGNYVITFNGEIYNFRNLIEMLTNQELESLVAEHSLLHILLSNVWSRFRRRDEPVEQPRHA